MKNLMVSLVIILSFTFFTIPALAAGPWKGKVIDIETKESLEGAVVLAVWERVYRTPTGASSYFYEAQEVLTDKDGRFEIPAYTPINLLPIISYLRGPSFTIFKPGYGSLRMGLGEYLTGETSNVEEFELSGKKYKVAPGIVELPPLKTREERIKVLPGIPIYEEAFEKAENYRKLLNIERIEIGLDPYPEKGGKKK